MLWRVRTTMPDRPGSLARLARVCRRVRTTGFALDDGEYIAEVRCIAAPIRDPNGEIVASVGISSPVTRLRRPLIVRASPRDQIGRHGPGCTGESEQRDMRRELAPDASDGRSDGRHAFDKPAESQFLELIRMPDRLQHRSLAFERHALAKGFTEEITPQ